MNAGYIDLPLSAGLDDPLPSQKAEMARVAADEWNVPPTSGATPASPTNSTTPLTSPAVSIRPNALASTFSTPRCQPHARATTSHHAIHGGTETRTNHECSSPWRCALDDEVQAGPGRTTADHDSLTERSPVLVLKEVGYSVHHRSGPWWRGACFRPLHAKHVLRDVSLALPAGQLIGLVGSSGSGKTSLLDVISFRAKGEVTGRMVYKGVTCTKDLMRQRVSYVIQADRLLPNLTVRETLTYTAYLKLPNAVHKHDIEKKVVDVINRIGLRGVADSRVGGAVVRGISGGEKRRLTIALHLLKDPDILLLDEPTTGLDSFTARHLVTSLKALARQGKLVVMSLHQPRSDIVKLLDQTALLCQGNMVYFGPTEQIVPYFTRLGYPCSIFANPLDTYMDIISIDKRRPDRQEVTLNRVQGLLEAYQSSDILYHTKTKVAEEVASGSSLFDCVRKGDSSPGWFRIFFTVVGRMNYNLYRNRRDLIGRLFYLPLFVVFIFIFLGRLRHNQSSIQDRIGLLYNTVSVPSYMGIINNVALFPSLRDHFYREGLDGLYGSHTFVLAYMLHILPFSIFSSAAFSSTLYWLCGMYPEAGRFGWHVLAVFWMNVSGEVVTVLFMGVFLQAQLANTVTSLVFTAFGLLATGFLRSLQNMPEVFQYLSWAVVHKYVSEIVVVNEFHKLNLTCEEEVTGVPCISSGEVIIDFNYPDAVANFDRNVEVMIGLVLGYLLLAILVYKLCGLKTMH